MQTSNLPDQQRQCADCGKQFVWTAGEQEFYMQKGLTHPPSRCPECRTKKREMRRANRPMTKITCGNCGKEDEVPFVPKQGTAVLCRECFTSQRQNKV